MLGQGRARGAHAGHQRANGRRLQLPGLALKRDQWCIKPLGVDLMVQIVETKLCSFDHADPVFSGAVRVDIGFVATRMLGNTSTFLNSCLA